jgi:hypothetical protein
MAKFLLISQLHEKSIGISQNSEIRRSYHAHTE